MSTSGSADDMATIVTRLSKELESVGLPGLASQPDGDRCVVDVIGLINASYDLIGLLRQLQHSKRQREDHAQQLLHDLQRSQWSLDKEKEVSVQREREAAEASEKERQAAVRLQLVETLLKKKNDEHRQLLHECQLKEKQWLHALRRRDQDNHRLNQQLLKFLRSKSSGGTSGFVPLELEIQGSLAPRMAGTVPRPLSDGPTRRKQWDRSPDDSRKLVEVKWQTALNSLEKEHQLLRNDHLQLIDTVGTFLFQCMTKLPVGRSTNPFANVKEWIQLPMAAMKDRLDQVFRVVEDHLLILPNQVMEVEPSDQVVLQKNNSFAVTEAGPIAQSQQSGLERNRTVDLSDWLNPMTKGKSNTHLCVIPHSGITTTSNIRSASGTKKSIPAEKSTFPTVDGVVTDVSQQQHTMGNQATHDGGNRTINWNEIHVEELPPVASHGDYLHQMTVSSSTKEFEASTSAFTIDENPSLDTPCPSECNSRRGSSSSSDSCSSWRSQPGTFEKDDRRPKFNTSTSKGASVTTRVYFVQPNASPQTIVLSENLVDVHLDVRSLTE